MPKKRKETPLMRQYNTMKAKYPDTLMLFRVGDFYETFSEDAIKASQILDITLTKRANGSASEVALAGFPHHALDTYLPRLVKAGLRVAICEQLEDPKYAKGLVKRGITEIVTPGISFKETLLNTKTNNYLAALHYEKNKEKSSVGLALLDISTGEFLTTQGDFTHIDNLLQAFKPSEIVYNQKCKSNLNNYLDDHLSFELEDWVFTQNFAEEKLNKHFKTTTLKGFGIENLNLGIIAAGAILHYLDFTEHGAEKTAHINKISKISQSDYVWLEKFTVRNLELIETQHEEGTPLIKILDHCVTPMGSRKLRKWVVLPLKNPVAIENRLDKVDYFIKHVDLHQEIIDLLKHIGDLERLIAKVSIKRITPRQLWNLKSTLEYTQKIKSSLSKSESSSIQGLAERLNSCENLIVQIEKYIHEEPTTLGQGNVIRKGINAELDEFRSIAFSGKDYLETIVKKEREKTGISSLKISYNKVFGYYLEVTNAHKDKVPYEWIRKQTLVNAERYITQELKEYENKILNAEEEIILLEQKYFEEILTIASEYLVPIQQTTQLLATVDCFCALASVASNYQYCRPTFNQKGFLTIKNGRHPVIEQQLDLVGESFIPNDIQLDPTKEQIWVITGPNMAGKSALLRQVGLIVLMAQMGSFVPAESADISIIDKLFTRVGASDNLSKGESTFMVEMFETATILNNITKDSLLLMDEIGRGTSTFDGISIAWAIIEYLHNHPTIQPKTLFATHYHELNELTHHLDRVKNYNVSVRQIKDKIVFLRKLVSGGSQHSFGINVAQMAGIPKLVVERAKEILPILEKMPINPLNPSQKESEENYQLQLFEGGPKAYKNIKKLLSTLDLNILTPIEGLMKLNDIKKIIEEEGG